MPVLISEYVYIRMIPNQTTIAIQKETRQLLQRHARKNQTYDEYLRELVAKCEKCEKESQLSDSGNGLPTGSAVRQHLDILKSKGVYK
jgi:hypothetical protein